MLSVFFQNEINLVKLLLNHSYCHDDGQQPEGQRKGGFSLSKQHSRQIFQIKPIQELPDDDDENGDDDDEEEGKEMMALTYIIFGDIMCNECNVQVQTTV